jgi:hypothetical protein
MLIIIMDQVRKLIGILMIFLKHSLEVEEGHLGVVDMVLKMIYFLLVWEVEEEAIDNLKKHSQSKKHLFLISMMYIAVLIKI